VRFHARVPVFPFGALIFITIPLSKTGSKMVELCHSPFSLTSVFPRRGGGGFFFLGLITGSPRVKSRLIFVSSIDALAVTCAFSSPSLCCLAMPTGRLPPCPVYSLFPNTKKARFSYHFFSGPIYQHPPSPEPDFLPPCTSPVRNPEDTVYFYFLFLRRTHPPLDHTGTPRLQHFSLHFLWAPHRKFSIPLPSCKGSACGPRKPFTRLEAAPLTPILRPPRDLSRKCFHYPTVFPLASVVSLFLSMRPASWFLRR